MAEISTNQNFVDTFRRISMDDSIEHLSLRIRDTMNNLILLWEEVHMDQSTREARIECAYLHIYTLLDDIVKSEQEMVKNVKSDIEARRIVISDLREMLKMPPFLENLYPNNSIPLLKALDKELKSLLAKRDEAIEEQLEEYETVKNLCYRLNVSPIFDYQFIKTTILSSDLLKKLKLQKEQLKSKIEKNVKRANQLQNDCCRMYKSLKETLHYTVEQQNLLNTDFNADSTQISDSIIENLENLYTYTNDTYDVWLEHATFHYSELLIAYRDLCEKCCLEPDNLTYPDNFTPKEHDQFTIDEIEIEIKNLQSRYKNGKNVFEKFQNWKLLWQEDINREKEASSSKFYNNRACELKAFLKRQRKLKLLVPQALKELKTEIRNYVDNGGDVKYILINEMLPDDLAEILMGEYKQQKELYRSTRTIASKTNSTPTITTNSGRRLSSKLKVQSGKIARRKMSLSKQCKTVFYSPLKTPTKISKSSLLRLRNPFMSERKYSPTKSIKVLSTIGNTTQKSRLPQKVPVSLLHKQKNIIETKNNTPLTSLQNLNKINTIKQWETPVSHWKH